MTNTVRAEVISAAKEAVRAYSKDPTLTNAAEVEAAWQIIRTLNAVSAWRQEPELRPNGPKHDSRI